MHPINKLLGLFGLTLARAQKTKKIPKEFLANYKRNLHELRKNSRGFGVTKEIYYELGGHPGGFADYECQFAAYHIHRLNPGQILDVGSYRFFILGLLATYPVTTVDVRDRKSALDSETIVSCDAKRLKLPDDCFDVVTSLCALEHFGLGRYGDEFDPSADRKALAEMVRVVRPTGHLILSTTITNCQPTIAFNAHRIYSYDMIRNLCANLVCQEEKFYSHELNRSCSLEEVTQEPQQWDVYLGCWRKGSDRSSC